MLFEYKGQKYKSMKAAAEAHGLDHRTVWSRLKSGKSLEEAFSQQALPKTGRSSPISIEGKTYSAVSVAAREYGISEKTIHGRLERGLSPEQAVGLEPFEERNKKPIIVGDEKFKSIAEAARYFGIPLYSVHNRLKRGRSIEEVFQKGELKRKSSSFISINVSGLKFEQLKDACEYFDLDYQKARYRLRRKWSLEQVFGIDLPPPNTAKNAPKTYSFRGKKYGNAKTLANEFGISADKFTRRLSQGWSLEEALELVEKNYLNKPQEVIVDGRKFATRNDAARFYQLNIGTVAARINKQGWTIEQALELAPPPAGFHTDFGAVYLIENNLNSKKYVGITLRNPPQKRFEEHIQSSAVAEKRLKGSLAEAIHFHGETHFSFKILKTAKTQADLQSLEKQFIEEYNTQKPDGYNLSKGGTIGRVPGRAVEIPSLGLKFKSVADAARHFNIDSSSLLYRLDKGYTPEQSVGLEPLNWQSPIYKKVNIDGMEFISIKEAAKHFGHPPNRVRNRVNKGWTIEAALKTPFVSRSKEIKIDGVTYPSMRQAARSLGISFDSLRYKIKKSNK